VLRAENIVLTVALDFEEKTSKVRAHGEEKRGQLEESRLLTVPNGGGVLDTFKNGVIPPTSIDGDNRG